MPGASLRNAMKRRTHKERAQPAKRRKRFGLLEKHKDYVERAKNYRQKRGRLRVLKEKAASRNPDEFYFGMVHGKTNKGVYDAGTQAGNGDDHKHQAAMMKLMRTQDASYVRMKVAVEQKKIERLSKDLHFLHGAQGGMSGPRPGKHTIFVDTTEESDAFDAATHFQTLPEYVHRTFNRPRIQLKKTKNKNKNKNKSKNSSSSEDHDSGSSSSDSDSSSSDDEGVASSSLIVHGDVLYKHVKRMRKKRDRKYQELGERIDRDESLSSVVMKMEEKKHLLTKGRRVQMKRTNKNEKILGGTKYYRWKSERKR